MTPRLPLILFAVALVSVGCKKAPAPAQAASVAGSATITSAATTTPGDLRDKLVGRWIEIRDWSGHDIAPELAQVIEIRADGTFVESNGTYRNEQKWRLGDVKGNRGSLQKHSEGAGIKMESNPLPFEIAPDGSIDFGKIRWARQDTPPPPVATSAEMKSFMALLDGKPGASARAVKAFGAPSAKEALKDLTEVDYKAVRVVRARASCYVLLANEIFLDVCWRGGKVVSAEPVDRWAK